MRRLLASLAVLACAAVASAEDAVQRTFTIEYGGRDEALREDCSRRLSAWWEEIVAPEKVPAGWDEKKLGPWSLVVRTSGGGFMEEKTGLVQVVIQVTEPSLPSQADAADAFARVVLEGLRSRVAARAQALVAGSVSAPDAQLAEIAARTRPLEAEREKLEVAHGGPPNARIESLVGRRAEVDRDVADTRIQLAVAARKLETARAAAERAVALERLRQDADRLDLVKDAGTAAEQAKKREAFDELRRRIDELSKTTPSLDSARETAFTIEVERVGLEARATVLAEERAALDASIRTVRRDATQWAEIARALEAAATQRTEAERRLTEAQRAVAERGPIFEVIRAPGPPAKEEKKR